MTDKQQPPAPPPPERIWIRAEVLSTPYLVEHFERLNNDDVPYARVHPVDDARVEEGIIKSVAAERVARSARGFCEELQEDAEGVPRFQLASLNEALDAWEAYPSTRDSYDDSQPVLAALASLIEDQHATDHQRRVAHLALAAIRKRTNVLDEAERDSLRRTIAESDITDGLLENVDIDALVNLFEAWLERRPSLLPQLSSSEPRLKMKGKEMMKTRDDGDIVVESLFCPPHLGLFKAGKLESIDSCIACIVAQRDEMKRRETAWLIEKRRPDGTYYVTVDGEFLWTKDVYKALRLARREDADLVAELVGDAELTSEHEWGDYERDAKAAQELRT